MRRTRSLTLGLAGTLLVALASTAQSRDDRLPAPGPGIGALFSGLRPSLPDEPSPDAPPAAEARPQAQSVVAARTVPMPRPAPRAEGLRAERRTVAAQPAPVRARQEELMAYSAMPQPQTPPSLFSFLAHNATPLAAAPVLAPAPTEVSAAAAATAEPEPDAAAQPRPLQAIGRRGAVPQEIDRLITAKAKQHNVPLALAHAVVRLESNYNPRAVGGRALGLMQIKHATARGIGFTGSAEQLMDPATNLEWGMRYLARAHELSRGNVCGTIMRYQSGHRAERPNGANLAYCARVRTLMARHKADEVRVDVAAGR